MDDTAAAVDGLGQFAHGVQAGAAAGPGEAGLHPAAVAGRAHQRQQAVGVDPLVPDGEFTLAGQAAEGRTVRGCRLQRGAVGLRVAVAVLAVEATATLAARRFVPLERARERLVEVVEVEEEGTFRGGVQAEVEEVRVAAELDGEAGVRLGRQVRGHHGGRAAQEREGEAAMRPYRIGRSSGSLSLPCRSSTATGSGRSTAGIQPAWAERATRLRAARPRSARSAGVVMCRVFACRRLLGWHRLLLRSETGSVRGCISRTSIG